MLKKIKLVINKIFATTGHSITKAKNNKEFLDFNKEEQFEYDTIIKLPGCLGFDAFKLFKNLSKLKDKEVNKALEIGVFCGRSLLGIAFAFKTTEITGVDLSNQQLNGLKKTYPQIATNAKQANATVHWTKLPFEICDAAFTQAVIMHIHTGDAHLIALENLFKMARKYVILYESPKNHPFKTDIKKLFDEGKIKWDNLYFYYRVDEKNNPNGIICSSLLLDYLELKNDTFPFKI